MKKAVVRLINVANRIGGLYADSEEYFDAESLDKMTGVRLIDMESKMTLTIEIDDYSDMEDISNELSMLVHDFNKGYPKSDLAGYTDEDIERMHKHINALYQIYTFGSTNNKKGRN